MSMTQNPHQPITHEFCTLHQDEKKNFDVLESCVGAVLVGKRYEPLFDYFKELASSCFRVVSDAYVLADSGTGIVHQVPWV